MDGRTRRAITERREQKGFSQDQLADASGVSQSTVSKIESDPQYSPTVANFAKVLTGLDLTLGQFFSELEADTDSSSVSKLHLPVTQKRTHTDASTSQTRGVYGADSSVRIGVGLEHPSVTFDHLRAELAALRQTMVKAGELLFTAGLAGVSEPDPARRAQPTRRYSGSRKPARKPPEP